MKKVTIVAQKPTRYRGKKIRKGARFDVSPHTARVFGALGRARIAAEADLGNGVPKLPPIAPPQPAPDPLADLRAEYEGLTGIAPDKRWGESRLRTEIRDYRDRRIAGEDPPAKTEDPLGPSNPGELL